MYSYNFVECSKNKVPQDREEAEGKDAYKKMFRPVDEFNQLYDIIKYISVNTLLVDLG